MRLDAFDGVAHAGDFAGGQVIHDNDISGFEFGHRNLLDTGLEGGAVHGAARNRGRDHSGKPQPGGEGGGFPMSVGDTGPASLPAWGPAPQACHPG